MTKILFIANSMRCGGVEKTLLNLLKVLDYSRYDVDLLLVEEVGEWLGLVPENVHVMELELPDSLRQFISGNNVTFKENIQKLFLERKYTDILRFVILKTIDAIGYKVVKKSYVMELCAQKASIKRWDYDIVCDYHGYAGITTCIATRFKNSKKYSWIHAEKIDRAYMAMKEKYLVFDGIFGVSDKCIENFLKLYSEPNYPATHVVQNVIFPAEIIHKADQAPAVEYDFGKNFLIVSVGRLSTQKGFDLAIEAASVLSQRGKPYKWLIIGEGSERQYLEKLIKKYQLENMVILHGYDSNPYAYIKKADIYVQTSRFEGFATTVTEAMILGKPVISTNVSGISKQILHGENGYIVPFEVCALVDRIVELMDNAPMRNMMGEGHSKMMNNAEQINIVLDRIFENNIIKK